MLLLALLLATIPLGWCEWGESEKEPEMEPEAGGLALCEWWVRRALVLTVISCPCSLVVAMPITFACGVAALARWGVLVKSSRRRSEGSPLDGRCSPRPALAHGIGGSWLRSAEA